MSKTSNKEELRKKLHEKIQMKKAGRMNNNQRKQKAEELYKKMGLSESDVKALAELSETIKKKQ
uniref:Uncharacterized protein n=1 Tax=viral metagenome TaxID=1070528 RepID=A0A6C0JML0_9ZZZZ